MSDDRVLRRDDGSIVTIVEPGWTRAVELGDDMAVLFYVDGTVRFRHRCDRAHRDGGILICAPALQIGNGHEVVTPDPLTIRASIACGDCPIHGFVTAGVWVPC